MKTSRGGGASTVSEPAWVAFAWDTPAQVANRQGGLLADFAPSPGGAP